jgi:cell division topological specificity factor MinE
MRFLDNFFKSKKEKTSGNIAQERLKLILARNKRQTLDFDIEAMEKELIAVVEKYVKSGNIEINNEVDGEMEALAIEVKF